MIATVTKEFRFEAAHHLPKHDGKCRFPHGHSYRLQVSVTSDVDDDIDSPKNGMVIDFADIKRVWKDHLEQFLDHQDLNDHFVFTTTAENLAAWILLVFRNNGVPVSMVELWETDSAHATVTPAAITSADAALLETLSAVSMRP